jgi:ATP-dependent DNA helicase RecG
MLSVLRDEDIIDAARDEATAIVASDPELAQSPALARAVAALLDDDQADYLEKS